MPTATLDPDSTVRTARKRSFPVALAVVALLAGYAVMALSASRTKSVAFDELAHMTAGYAYWEKGDFRLQPENGNFPQRWAALPYLFTHPALPPPTYPVWQQAEIWGLGTAFLHRSVNDPDHLLLQARSMIVIFGVITGALVFWWARELHGLGGGFVALALAVFCPALLAHGAIATSDMALTCVLLAATYALWKLLQKITALRLAASLVAGALLFLTKMSAPLFLPVAAILIAVRYGRGEPWLVHLGGVRHWTSRRQIFLGLAGGAVLHAVFIWGAIWAAYDFRFAAAPPNTPGAEQFSVNFTGELGPSTRLLHALEGTRILPRAYLYGYEHVLRASVYRFAFLNGAHGFGGWPAFFPYAFLVKTPLAFFPLFALALWELVQRGRSPRVRETLLALAPLLALLLVFGVAAITARLNIGHRHILPLLPPLYILTGAAWPRALAGRLWQRCAVVVLVALFALESWMIRPHYLAFFNRIAGGPDQAWHHLVDSSLDWGMDLPALRDWLRENRRAEEPIHFGYFGMGRPDDYGFRAISLTTYYGAETRGIGPLTPGLYVVSATLLQVYAPAFGPWNKVYEARYQEVVTSLANFYALPPEAAQRALAEKGPDFWAAEHRTFNDLRFGRLCAWLRHRPPLAQVAHTLLIWRLTNEDLRAAQIGPPAELADAPVAVPTELR